jgi:Ca2+-binding RTX toxin-like protein
MPIFDGTAGDDVLKGTSGDDVINGLAGADTIYGDAGNDELNGGDGTDLIYGGAGDDRIDGGIGGVPPGPNGQPPAVYERIFAEDGHDTVIVNGAQDGRYVQADGGAGTDTLVVNHTASQFLGFGYAGFERLHIENALNVSYASNFQWITIADSSVNFANSYNPVVDLALQNQSLSMAFSFFRSITGGNGNENIWVGQGSTISGNIALGDGDDRIVLNNYWPGPAPTISIAQGGAGRDQFDVWSGNYKSLSLNLSNATEFEVFGFNSEYGDRHGTLTVANLTGVTEVRVGQTSTLVLTQSQLFGAVLTGAFDGGYTLETGVVVGRYGFPADGPWDRSTDLIYGNSSLSTTFVNRGTVEGDVAFYTGDDLYDGRDGTIGGTVFGNAGNDTLLGGSGNERFQGGYGDDLLSGGGGDDSLKGGEGRDTISYAGAARGVTVNLGLAGAQDTVGAGTDTLSGFEVLIGSDHADRLSAGAGNNLILAGGGDDRLVSSGDSDRLYGEAGNDTFVSNGANDEIDGGDGFDTVDFSAASEGVNTNWPLRLLNIERAIGSSFNDFLSGAAEMIGGAGNDVYTVYSGNKVVEAAGQGIDRVESWGKDYALPDNVENLTLYFDPYAGATIEPHGVRNGTGNSLDNVMIGSFGANRLSGMAGSDTLYGGAGDDLLDGGSGADILDGGDGNDRIVYDAGDDMGKVIGGTGNDVLVVRGAAPTSFDLHGQGFEAAEVTVAGQGNIVSTVTTYNGNWQVVEATTKYTDGSQVTVSADPTNAYDTRQVWYSYDMQNRLSSVDNLYDNGTRLFVNMDEDNSKEWRQDWSRLTLRVGSIARTCSTMRARGPSSTSTRRISSAGRRTGSTMTRSAGSTARTWSRTMEAIPSSISTRTTARAGSRHGSPTTGRAGSTRRTSSTMTAAILSPTTTRPETRRSS